MTAFLRQHCVSQSTRVGRASFPHDVRKTTTGLTVGCLQVKNKKPFTLNSLRETSKLPVTATLSHAVMLAQPPVTTLGMSQQSRTVTSNTKPRCTENRSHTQSTRYKPHLPGQIRKYQQNPKNGRFLLQVMNSNHTGLRLPALRQIRGRRRGRGLSLSRL